MKIIIDNRINDPKSPIITIDATPCTDLYSLSKTIELALKLEGYDEKAIDTIFGRESVTSATRCGVISTEITSLVAEYNGNLTNNISKTKLVSTKNVNNRISHKTKTSYIDLNVHKNDIPKCNNKGSDKELFNLNTMNLNSNNHQVKHINEIDLKSNKRNSISGYGSIQKLLDKDFKLGIKSMNTKNKVVEKEENKISGPLSNRVNENQLLSKNNTNNNKSF